MKFYTEEEALDMTLGEKGTQLRDEYEKEFMKFFVFGTVLWKNGANTAPEYLYENGTTA